MVRNSFKQTFKQKMGLAGVVGGLFLGLPLISASVFAAPNSANSLTAQGGYSSPGQSQTSPTEAFPSLNPCPSIYYEEPFNSTRIVPTGCPANAATLDQQGQTSGQSSVAPNPAVPGQRPVAPSTEASEELNPCPSVYYEEPFNSTRIVPTGCPANDATRNQ